MIHTATQLKAIVKNRGSSNLLRRRVEIIKQIENDPDIKKHWKEYQDSYDYATIFSLNDVINALNTLLNQMDQIQEKK